MSSFGAAAEAASTRAPTPVVARETLYEGAIISIKIPNAAIEGHYPKGDERIPYLRFTKTVRGGVVNLFIHTDDLSVIGKHVIAAVRIIKKVLVNGRQYLHVDLIPVSDDTPVTHRLVVMNTTDGSWKDVDHLAFETPEPLGGVIILGPPDMKAVPVEAPKKSSTGDSQLDRLLADGWEIEMEGTAKVKLFKMKGGVQKTLIHHRSKATCA